MICLNSYDKFIPWWNTPSFFDNFSYTYTINPNLDPEKINIIYRLPENKEEAYIIQDLKRNEYLLTPREDENESKFGTFDSDNVRAFDSEEGAFGFMLENFPNTYKDLAIQKVYKVWKKDVNYVSDIEKLRNEMLVKYLKDKR